MAHHYDDEWLYKRFPTLRDAERDANLQSKKRLEILKLAPKNGIGVEIGVFTGGFSRVLFNALNPSFLHLVDPYWKLYGDLYPDWGAYTAGGTLSTRDAAKIVELRCKSSATGTGHIRLHVDFSVPWLNQWPKDSFDWVYLDASHEYTETLDELRAIAKTLKPKGIIMGDDFWTDPDGKHYGVVRAVHTFLREQPFELIRADRYGQFALRRDPRSLKGVVNGRHSANAAG